MDKEEAIKIVKKHYPANEQLLNEALEFIIPELKKKTDEEMLQKLITIVHLYYGEGVDAERDECLEWLEKQSKNKSIERKDFISIPFGTDSELIEEIIRIPKGYVATIEGQKVYIKKK